MLNYHSYFNNADEFSQAYCKFMHYAYLYKLYNKSHMSAVLFKYFI